jgi:hypothetical protein
MDDPEKIRRRAQRDDAVLRMALTVLLARAGGSLTFTKDEYHALTSQYGGNIHFEGLGRRGSTATDEIRVVLVRKPPGGATFPA